MEKQKMNYAEIDHKMNNLKKTKESIDNGRKKYLTDEEFEKILHDKLQTLTKDINDMSLEELKEISPVFEADIFEAISMETCVNKRLTIGAPGQEAMKKVIAIEKEYLSKDWKEELTDWESKLVK